MTPASDERERGATRIPPLSILLGFGPMLPFIAGAAAVWLVPVTLRLAVVDAVVLWGCAILIFLAGVRRGLSFRTAGGPTPAQIGTMLALFCIGAAALVAERLGTGTTALACLAVGFAAAAFLDPLAVRYGEVPAFFARLRPLQMPIAVISLLVVLAKVWAVDARPNASCTSANDLANTQLAWNAGSAAA